MMLTVQCTYVFYRANASEFIIPVHKFLKSLDHTYQVGMRFRMRFESEDSAERRCGMIVLAVLIIFVAIVPKSYITFPGRYTGLITGIADMDPVRWPGSKWRRLLVWACLPSSCFNLKFGGNDIDIINVIVHFGFFYESHHRFINLLLFKSNF